MKYIPLICLGLASVVFADLNVDPNQSNESQNASSSALDAAGSARQFGINNMSEGSFEEFTGANTDSTANFGGSSTNMGLSQTIDFNLSCVEDASKYAGGYMFYSSGCSVTGTSVISHSIRWCYLKDGIRCSEEGSLSLGSGDVASIQASRLTSVNCRATSCNYSFSSSLTSSFDGSNLEQEGSDLDDAEGSFVFDSIEEITGNPDLGFSDAQNEAAGLQGYIDRSYGDLTESGEMPIYRNSEDDIARFGERIGSISVPFGTDEESTVCTGIDLTQLESCNSPYPVIEYTCEPTDDLSCHYKREMEVENCTRRRIVSCDSFNVCQNQTDFNNAGPLSNLRKTRSEGWGFNVSYPSITVSSCNDNCLDPGFYKETMSFNIDNMSKLLSFKLSSYRIDDFFGLIVNGRFVHSSWDGQDRTSTGRYPVGEELVDINTGPIFGSPLPFMITYIVFDDSSRTNDDKGNTSLSPNINLIPYLVEGENNIEIAIGVLGSGEAHLNFTVTGNCSCNTSEYWEESCNAVF